MPYIENSQLSFEHKVPKPLSHAASEENLNGYMKRHWIYTFSWLKFVGTLSNAIMYSVVIIIYEFNHSTIV